MARQYALCMSLVAAAVVLAFASTPRASAAGKSDMSEAFELCGPRCVAFVLGQLGHRVELVDLLRDAGSNPPRSMSMYEIQSLLQRHGLTATAVQLVPGDRLVYDKPVIVHLSAEALGRGGGVGHFIVWLPNSDDENVVYWDGLAGEATVHSDFFYSKISPDVILVAPSGKIDVDRAISFHLGKALPTLGSTLGTVCMIASVCVGVPVLLLLWRNRHAAY